MESDKENNLNQVYILHKLFKFRRINIFQISLSNKLIC